MATQESLAGGSMFASWRETMNNYIFQNTREPRTCSGVSHRIHLCFGSSPRFPRWIDHPVLFDRVLFRGSTLGLPAFDPRLCLHVNCRHFRNAFLQALPPPPPGSRRSDSNITWSSCRLKAYTHTHVDMDTFTWLARRCQDIGLPQLWTS